MQTRYKVTLLNYKYILIDYGTALRFLCVA